MKLLSDNDYEMDPLIAQTENTKQFGVHNGMKEFTKFTSQTSKPKNASVMIRLKDDGSFETLRNSNVYEESLGLGQLDSYHYNNDLEFVCDSGRWHFEDGQIMLVPLVPARRILKREDTLLFGKMLACTHAEDVSNGLQFSVPFGNIESGKFMYPPDHVSFFDAHPIWKPKDVGRFQFQRVVKELPPVTEVEKYKVEDLAGKKFFITAEPLKKKKKERWSRSLGKMVEIEEEDGNVDINPFVAGMQVMEVQLYGNHTFTTTAGLGSSVTLRGRWDVIGQDKDQLWMQIWRFGFGRSVSGS